jgi:hypothetical protein
VQHVAGSYRSEVIGMKGYDGNCPALRRNELHLERVAGVAMHDSAYVPLFKAVLRERTAKHYRVMWLHR